MVRWMGSVLIGSVFLATLGIAFADLILPRPNFKRKENASKFITFRIINRSAVPIYLQGIRQGKEEHLVLNLFHRNKAEGWKPFFDYLPCDLPQCEESGQPRKPCPKKGTFFPIRVRPEGVYELVWKGRFYERTEAIVENKRGQYCYHTSVPKEGTVHFEVEYSERLSGSEVKRDRLPSSGRIGPRERAAIEFTLPARKRVMELVLP